MVHDRLPAATVRVIAEDYAKGFRRYDVGAMLQAIASAVQDRNNLKEYAQKGYISTVNNKKEQKQSVSQDFGIRLRRLRCIAHGC